MSLASTYWQFSSFFPPEPVVGEVNPSLISTYSRTSTPRTDHYSDSVIKTSSIGFYPGINKDIYIKYTRSYVGFGDLSRRGQRLDFD